MEFYNKFKYNLGVLEPDEFAERAIKSRIDSFKPTTPIDFLTLFWNIKRDAGDNYFTIVNQYTTDDLDQYNNSCILKTMSEVSFLEYAYDKLGYAYIPRKKIPLNSSIRIAIQSYMSSRWNPFDVLIDGAGDDAHDTLWMTMKEIFQDYRTSDLYNFLFTGSTEQQTISQLDFLSIWLGNSDIERV